jgi:transposase-like protein
MRYSEAFKSKMVRRMTGPDALSANALSLEMGIGQTTLSRWLREASSDKVSAMTNTKTKKSRRPGDWAPEEKIAAVAQAATLSEEELGAFLRRKGLHEAQLEAWKASLVEALTSQPSRRKKAPPENRRVRELEKELRRKDKALAEASTLLVLKKKAQAIWGDEDKSTTPRSGR